MIVAVIPARLKSTRFPEKPLALICGKPMIQHVYERALQADCFDEIIVATDSQKIVSVVNSFCGKAELTATDVRSGSDRVWLVIKNIDCDYVVNIQGDEPLIPSNLLADISRALIKGNCPVVSAACKNYSPDDFYSPDIVKVIINTNNQALYFSRAPIPCHSKNHPFSFFWQHIGIYGYSKNSLRLFAESVPGDLEIKENLEQLRFLEKGVPIKIIHSDYQSIGVDRPDDINKVESYLTQKP